MFSHIFEFYDFLSIFPFENKFVESEFIHFKSLKLLLLLQKIRLKYILNNNII